MTLKNIANLIPTVQAASLLNENLKAAKTPKKDGSGKGIRANRGRMGCDTTELIGLGTKNIIGISLIKAESDLIAGL